LFVTRNCLLIDTYSVRGHVLITIQFKKLRRDVKNFNLIQSIATLAGNISSQKQQGRNIVAIIVGQLSRLNGGMLDVSLSPINLKRERQRGLKLLGVLLSLVRE